MKALIVDEPWISLILSSEKTWEMRSQHTSLRGRIALIRKGSGQVVGVADLVDSIGPLDAIAWRAHIDKHRVPLGQQHRTAAWNVAWVLRNANPLDSPVRYQHPRGAMIWVDLGEETVQQFRLAPEASLTKRPESVVVRSALMESAKPGSPLEALPGLVPIARDGSWFSPSLRRSTGFTIGPKGEEFQVSSYRDALARLRLMPTPRWRRPNANGNWGIVAGVRWAEPSAQ